MYQEQKKMSFIAQ